RIHVGRRRQLASAHAGHLLPHRRHEGGIVGHSLHSFRWWVSIGAPGSAWEWCWSPWIADLRVCQARLAHLTRIGNSDTPENTASFPRVSGASSASVPVTRRRNRSN